MLAPSVVSAHSTLRLSHCNGGTIDGSLKSTTATVSRQTPQLLLSSSSLMFSVVLTPCGCTFLASLFLVSTPPPGGVHTFSGCGACSYKGGGVRGGGGLVLWV